jgi:3-hydroxyisobutyrate dehydrogenase-like beta-hydroxyacid dehydrogenase
MRVGFIGVGVMGAPIARNILKGGFPVTVHDVDGAAADRLVAAGATRAESPRAVTTGSDVVVTMVPDAPDVEAVALGSDGILAGARPGLIYIDMSTIDPLTIRRVGAALAARGVRMIDCPVGRTTAHAEAGRLLLMLGG